jgi:hypothetical protein
MAARSALKGWPHLTFTRNKNGKLPRIMAPGHRWKMHPPKLYVPTPKARLPAPLWMRKAMGWQKGMQTNLELCTSDVCVNFLK